jgi:hypothetical protein
LGVALSTKREILDYLRGNKWLDLEGLSDGDTFVLKSQWSFPDGRSQVVWVQINDTYHQLMSPYAKEEDISAERALNMNSTLFGVSKCIGHFCLVAVGMNSSFSKPEFEMMEQLIAKNADDIEKNSGGGDQL